MGLVFLVGRELINQVVEVNHKSNHVMLIKLVLDSEHCHVFSS